MGDEFDICDMAMSLQAGEIAVDEGHLTHLIELISHWEGRIRYYGECPTTKQDLLDKVSEIRKTAQGIRRMGRQ
jgi:hypothetical protein